MKTPSISSCVRIGLIVIFVLVPGIASAATIYLETASSTVSVGDTVVVGAYLDSDSASTNVVSGGIDLSLDTPVFKVDGISTGGSVLTIWPVTPALSADGTHIPFTGGVPGGFSGPHQFLFSIILTPTAPGDISFTPEDTMLYLNNGLGTAVPVTGSALTLSAKAAPAGALPSDQSNGTLSNDTTPPAPFSIVESQNPSLFNGQKFITFQTTDTQSGIDYYEVKEGSAAPVRSGTLYVLKDQTSAEPIIVYAFDHAGNFRTASFTTRSTRTSTILLTLGIIVVLLVIAFAAWYLRRMRTL